MSLALYIFINTDLKMNPCKCAAQCGNSVQYIIQNFFNKSYQKNYHFWRNTGARKNTMHDLAVYFNKGYPVHILLSFLNFLIYL